MMYANDVVKSGIEVFDNNPATEQVQTKGKEVNMKIEKLQNQMRIRRIKKQHYHPGIH